MRKLTDEEREDRRAKKLEYYKVYRKEREKDPAYLEARRRRVREYMNTPEMKEKRKLYKKTPYCPSKQKEYMSRPGVRDKARKSGKEYKNRKYRNPQGRILYLATQAAFRARQKGLEYDTAALRQLAAEPPLHCKCCGKEFLYAERGKAHLEHVPSIDRIDNSKGYIAGNVAIICNRCNKAKRDSDVELLKKIITYMEANL